LILAIFDLDDTLTMQDTESLWQSFLVKKGLIPNELLFEKKEAFRLAYEAGVLNFQDIVEFSINPISYMTIKEQLSLQEEFSLTVLKHAIIPQGIELVTSHYEQGHTVIIISAGHEFLIQPAAKFFPVHHVLCTILQRTTYGAFAPFINGKALYREEKVHSLYRWLAEQQNKFTTTYFYSDSINDLPLLEIVDIPIAANPCPRLRTVAQTRNWSILELKQAHLNQLQQKV